MTLLDLKADDKLVKEIIKIADKFYEEDSTFESIEDSGFTKETLFDKDSPMLPIIKSALRKSRMNKGNKTDILLEEISKELRKPYRFGDPSSKEAMQAIEKQLQLNMNSTFQYVIAEVTKLSNCFRENEGLNSLQDDDICNNDNLKRLTEAICTAVISNSKTMMEVPYSKVDCMIKTSDIKKMVEEFALLI